MGWGSGWLTGWNAATREYERREVGYLYAAQCDVSGCEEVIDRGLGYRCGLGTADDVDGPLAAAYYAGCGGFFCSTHNGAVGHSCPAPRNWGPEGDDVVASDAWLGCQTVGVGEESHPADDDIEDALERGEDPPCPLCVVERVEA